MSVALCLPRCQSCGRPAIEGRRSRAAALEWASCTGRLCSGCWLRLILVGQMCEEVSNATSGPVAVGMPLKDSLPFDPAERLHRLRLWGS